MPNSISNCYVLRNSYQDIPIASYSGPITITKGGTYSGNWRSSNINIPPVFINTLDPVFIVNSRVRGTGDLVSMFRNGTQGKAGNVTIHNCYAYNEDPMTSGAGRGRFARFNYGTYLNISNNYIVSSGGIYLLKSQCPISIKYNCVHNLGGLVSSVTPNKLCAVGIKAGGTYCGANFVQLNLISSNPNIEIAWNEMVNTPYESAGEDHINIYQTSGTVASPIRIHNNYFQGIYPNSPDTVIMTGAGMNIGDSANTAASELATGYVECANNHIVSVAAQGITTGSGSNSLISKNRVISSGYFVYNGTVRKFKSTEIGIQVWDYFKVGPTLMFNNSVKNNYVGFMCNVRAALHRVDYSFNLTAMLPPVNNTGPPLSYNITLADEAAEYEIWKAKLLANKIQLGLHY